MTLNDVARRLEMVLSPAQELYREARRAGRDKHTARQLAIDGAPSRAASQTLAVLKFVQAHAVWTIPEEAGPQRDRHE